MPPNGKIDAAAGRFLPSQDEDYASFQKEFGKCISHSKTPVATENLLTVREHVVRGIGYSFLPAFLIQNEVKRKTLTIIETNTPPIHYSFYIVSKNRAHLPSRVALLRKQIMIFFSKAKH